MRGMAYFNENITSYSYELSAYKMAKRIYNREDNVYGKKVITKQLIISISRFGNVTI